jgi:hypothetical protein
MIVKKGFPVLFTAVIVFLLPFVYSGASAEASKPVETTVCAVSSHPEVFAGKLLRVSGELNSDGMHAVVLTDTHCKEYGITLTAIQAFVGEAKYRKALGTGNPGTLDKRITGIFVGRFVWQPKKLPKRVLVLREVHGLSIERLTVSP